MKARTFFMVSLLTFFIFTAVPAFAGGRKGIQPPPRLFEPSEETDLAGKGELLFRWSNEGDRNVIHEYQFKVYKGTETIEAGLIKTETIPARLDRISLPADLFENNGTYSWQLRGTGSGKTRPATEIFKVKK